MSTLTEFGGPRHGLPWHHAFHASAVAGSLQKNLSLQGLELATRAMAAAGAETIFTSQANDSEVAFTGGVGSPLREAELERFVQHIRKEGPCLAADDATYLLVFYLATGAEHD